jgi:serine/threonine-protein kinase
MDADLARAARGQAVAPETEEAATQVLKGVGAARLTPVPDQTAITRRVNVGPPSPPAYSPPTGFYEYDEPIRRRSFWPWLLATLLVAAAIVAGWYVYTKIQDQLSQTKPVAMPLVQGTVERLAVQKIRAAGLEVQVIRHSNKTYEAGRVYSQDHEPGARLNKGFTVRIFVSTGAPKVSVPSVVGKQATDAVAALTQLGLKADIHNVNSSEQTNTVTGQDPKPGTRLTVGEKVRINVSQGPKPVAVPPVVGSPYESAAGQLQGSGFAVARVDEDSDQPRGVVIRMSPAANSLAGPGSTVTLYVSKGPATSSVPDVTSFARSDAIATLRNSGFKVVVDVQDTDDPSLDGVVMTQTPGPGEAAKPGSTVTITVGRFTAPPPETTTTATPPTDTVQLDTTVPTSPSQ